jgi:hypothetical protein
MGRCLTRTGDEWDESYRLRGGFGCEFGAAVFPVVRSGLYLCTRHGRTLILHYMCQSLLVSWIP